MPTATVQVESVQGFPGKARCYRVDPPYQGNDYVTIWVQPSFGQHQLPEVGVVPAVESGAGAELSVKRRPGSFVLHDNPDTDDKIDGAFWMALLMLGGYQA